MSVVISLSLSLSLSLSVCVCACVRAKTDIFSYLHFKLHAVFPLFDIVLKIIELIQRYAGKSIAFMVRFRSPELKTQVSLSNRLLYVCL